MPAFAWQKSISMWAPSFAGSDQQDSQEFLSFLLDGLHEDLNRIRAKPPPVEMTPEREAALETLPPAVAAEKEWKIYKMRNDSLIVDLFQGQYRNRMECLTCHKVCFDLGYPLALDLTRGSLTLPDFDDLRRIHVHVAACSHWQDQGCHPTAHRQFCPDRGHGESRSMVGTAGCAVSLWSSSNV
jgi:hypothetical protein